MLKVIGFVFTAAAASLCTAPVGGQQSVKAPAQISPFQLTVEVAASTIDGTPSVLRAPLTNQGDTPIDMPMPESNCMPAGGWVQIHVDWTPEPAESATQKGSKSGWGCSQSNRPSLISRVHSEWIRLLPGEYIVMNLNIRGFLVNFVPGIVEYWAEYIPPTATPTELAQLQNAGYVIPTKKAEPSRQKFTVY